METEVIKYIMDNEMLEENDRVGVAVSGGADSMALLTFLTDLSKKIRISILAVHINHNIRKESRKDAKFVKDFCAEKGIDCVVYNINVPEYAAQTKMGIEQAAREMRYQSFEKAIEKYKLNKFAVAHHLNDQAETILMHIFRGCGLDGAAGMLPVRGIYIRPFLETKKTDLIAYNYRNGTPNIFDSSNEDNNYARNFIRNVIMPEITKEWRTAPENIVAFGKIALRDSNFIASQYDLNGVVKDGNVCRIPLNRFAFPEPVISRIIYAGLEMLKIRGNVELKHIESIMQLGVDGLNGERVDLPNNSYAVKEYEYISLVKKEKKVEQKEYPFRVGKTTVEGFGIITITKTISHKLAIQRGLLVVDAEKLPKKAKWRFRMDGDIFTKFGGGTKKLNAFFTDKKIPARLRPTTPVLALGNEIFVVGGVEISDKVKTDRDTLDAFVLEFTRQ